nr:hypothetical protein [Tanacetum cinerariifolium]GEZ50048.1 hypothetical protein [Tanacetum cinerariifolium]
MGSSTERVKISLVNVKLKTTVHQKEEPFQVIIDVIKNSTYFKAFTIFAEVTEIFMQQFWYTIKKVKDIESYEFLLANKKCIVNAKVFRKILDICPRVEAEEFADVQDDDDATLTFLIDVRKQKKSRREIMPFSRFTKVIINHFRSQHKSLFKLKFQHYHTIKYDGIVSKLKFVRIREDYQEYGLHIPDMMQNDKMKQSDSYQMFLKYSNGLIPPKKSRGKWSQGNKTTDVSQESVDVSDESEPEPAKKRLNKKLQILCKLSKKARKPAEYSKVLKAQVKELYKDNDGDGDVDDEDEDDDHISDIQDTDDEDTQTKSDEDEIYKYTIQVHKDVDVEMVGVETFEFENKERDEMTDAAKADVEKTAKEKGDAELARNSMTSDYQVKVSTELPLPSFSLSVSSGFGTHFLNLFSNVSLTGVLKDSVEAEISSLMDVHIQQETPQIQSSLVLKVPVSMILKTTTLPPIQEIYTETLVSTALSPPHVTPTILIMQQTTTPIPTSPITTEALTITTAVLESDAHSVVQLSVA